MARQTLKRRIQNRIARTRSGVFLPREFGDLGGEDQVLRALRELVRQKELIKLGYGVYGRAMVSRLSGEAMLDSTGGFIGAVQETLDKLRVPWEASAARTAYNEGRSTQVPVNPTLRIKGRFSRKLRLGNTEFRRER